MASRPKMPMRDCSRCARVVGAPLAFMSAMLVCLTAAGAAAGAAASTFAGEAASAVGAGAAAAPEPEPSTLVA